jgi:hypothetical protein
MIIVLKRFRKVRKIGSEENIELFNVYIRVQNKITRNIKKVKIRYYLI